MNIDDLTDGTSRQFTSTSQENKSRKQKLLQKPFERNQIKINTEVSGSGFVEK